MKKNRILIDRSNAPFRGRIFVFSIVPIAIGIGMSIFNLFVVQSAIAQDKIDFTYPSIGIESDTANVIQNINYLDEFFESLYQLKNKGDRKINIIHIGDSHIQADYLTHIVRRNFQLHFGNAGRGLVVPAKLAGTNDAFNIVSASESKWNSKKIIFPGQPLPIGIGGITIYTDQPNVKLSIYLNDLWMDYAFNEMILFFQKDSTAFDFSVKDTTGQQLAYFGPFTKDEPENYSHVTLPHSVTSVTLETIKSASAQTNAAIFGVDLENGYNGILYHAIGINGAKYEHYNAAAYFAKQTAALNPNLFIISLGTNEALNFPYVDKNFSKEIDKLVTGLRENNPDAKFILVTPPDAFRKRVRSNPAIAKIREQIIQYAAENGLAFWDMYKAMGGDHSSITWRANGLLRPDGIHFTKEGYEYQGNLLYNALIKGYNQYVPLRHP